MTCTHPTGAQARIDREAYFKAMIAGHIDTCIAIEQRYGLFGETPEIVAIGLSAAAEGKDVDDAIEAYFDEAATK